MNIEQAEEEVLFATTVIVRDGVDRAISGMIDKRLVDKLYAVYDEMVEYQRTGGISAKGE